MERGLLRRVSVAAWTWKCLKRFDTYGIVKPTNVQLVSRSSEQEIVQIVARTHNTSCVTRRKIKARNGWTFSEELRYRRLVFSSHYTHNFELLALHATWTSFADCVTLVCNKKTWLTKYGNIVSWILRCCFDVVQNICRAMRSISLRRLFTCVT